jgi:hypothetical protein
VRVTNHRSRKILCLLLKPIKELETEVYMVGDCIEPRRILEAVSEGHHIGSII